MTRPHDVNFVNCVHGIKQRDFSRPRQGPVAEAPGSRPEERPIVAIGSRLGRTEQQYGCTLFVRDADAMFIEHDRFQLPALARPERVTKISMKAFWVPQRGNSHYEIPSTSKAESAKSVRWFLRLKDGRWLTGAVNVEKCGCKSAICSFTVIQERESFAARSECDQRPTRSSGNHGNGPPMFDFEQLAMGGDRKSTRLN